MTILHNSRAPRIIDQPTIADSTIGIFLFTTNHRLPPVLRHNTATEHALSTSSQVHALRAAAQ